MGPVVIELVLVDSSLPGLDVVSTLDQVCRMCSLYIDSL
jgi:hypothetical protein